MVQPELFDAGPRIRMAKHPCTPASPGSGPAGETCKTCRHITTMPGVAGRYLKCGLMQHEWSRGPGTDIKARWPACSAWEGEP